MSIGISVKKLKVQKHTFSPSVRQPQIDTQLSWYYCQADTLADICIVKNASVNIPLTDPTISRGNVRQISLGHSIKIEPPRNLFPFQPLQI